MVSYPSDPSTIKQWELPGTFLLDSDLLWSHRWYCHLSFLQPSRVQDNLLVLVWESHLWPRYDYIRVNFSVLISPHTWEMLYIKSCWIAKSRVGFTARCAFSPSRCSSVGLCEFTALPQRAQVTSTAREICQTITASMWGCRKQGFWEKLWNMRNPSLRGYLLLFCVTIVSVDPVIKHCNSIDRPLLYSSVRTPLLQADTDIS